MVHVFSYQELKLGIRILLQGEFGVWDGLFQESVQISQHLNRKQFFTLIMQKKKKRLTGPMFLMNFIPSSAMALYQHTRIFTGGVAMYSENNTDPKSACITRFHCYLCNYVHLYPLYSAPSTYKDTLYLWAVPKLVKATLALFCTSYTPMLENTWPNSSQWLDGEMMVVQCKKKRWISRDSPLHCI